MPRRSQDRYREVSRVLDALARPGDPEDLKQDTHVDLAEAHQRGTVRDPRKLAARVYQRRRVDRLREKAREVQANGADTELEADLTGAPTGDAWGRARLPANSGRLCGEALRNACVKSCRETLQAEGVADPGGLARDVLEATSQRPLFDNDAEEYTRVLECVLPLIAKAKATDGKGRSVWNRFLVEELAPVFENEDRGRLLLMVADRPRPRARRADAGKAKRARLVEVLAKPSFKYAGRMPPPSFSTWTALAVLADPEVFVPLAAPGRTRFVHPTKALQGAERALRTALKQGPGADFVKYRSEWEATQEYTSKIEQELRARHASLERYFAPVLEAQAYADRISRELNHCQLHPWLLAALSGWLRFRPPLK
jgi:hypothetical protein